MAESRDTTLLLGDASLEQQIRDALTQALDGPGQFFIEPASQYPGQELALDLFASDRASLETLLTRVRRVLADELGVSDILTSDEFDQAHPAA